jgi:two-component system, cell cycle response regulator DivK
LEWVVTKKILIVEDNEMNRDMLSRRLMRKGYEILIAVDGAIGLEMMKSERPDLVLMDMGLPVMDGWTATANAKADSDLRNIPIIALTAHALEADRLRALEAGADDFDTKPVNLSGLLEKMEALLQG